MPKTSTFASNALRAYQARQRAGKPIRQAPKSASERGKQYRERDKMR